MTDKTENSGKELLDMDEKGNPIEKEENKNTKNISSNIYKYGGIIIIILLLLGLCYFFFNKNISNKDVFDETTLKNLKLKNRVFFGPICHVAEKIENIVKNDVSLLITEGAVVGDFTFSKLQPDGPFRIDTDEYIPEIKKLADIVHKYNSYILLDLVHQGLISTEQPCYSPSGGKGLINKDIESTPMTKDDIKRIQDYFVQGALRAKKAGYDGVEVHGAQLSLVSLFSSTVFNRRTDEYGGSDENRARFIVEIVQKIREAVGKDFIISAKIDSTDQATGFTESGFLYLGKALEEAGLDLMEVSGPNPIRQGEDPYFYEDTKKIAEILKIPVICIGGISKYEQADYILKNSKIQYIAMSRELLKQPDIVKKWYLNK
jgi:2,4-dienoyl-CoA reductase-like NADH-dependent reductase (Old Yellow Enzyme family)